MEDLYIQEEDKMVEMMIGSERGAKEEWKGKMGKSSTEERNVSCGQRLGCSQICISTTVSLECHTGHAT